MAIRSGTCWMAWWLFQNKMFTKWRQVVGRLIKTKVLMKVDDQIDWVDRHRRLLYNRDIVIICCGCAVMLWRWLVVGLVGGWCWWLVGALFVCGFRLFCDTVKYVSLVLETRKLCVETVLVLENGLTGQKRGGSAFLIFTFLMFSLSVPLSSEKSKTNKVIAFFARPCHGTHVTHYH